MASQPFRLAVVGGRRGGAFGLALEHLRDRLQLTAVCDPLSSVRERWAAEQPGIRTFADYRELLNADICDAVFLATPMQLHASQVIAALDAGKHIISEVTACVSHDEALAMIAAVERSGLTYMMAENYVYRRPQMMVRHMVEQGVFGELTYAEGMYLHDIRGLKFHADGSLTWRGELARDMPPCNYYPTHSFGPIAQWMDIGNSDQLASVYCVGTKGLGMAEYARERFGPEHRGASPEHWRRGDGASCLVTTERGRVISLRIDTSSSRPHHTTTHELQGTRAAFRTQADPAQGAILWIDGLSSGANPPRSTESPDWQEGDPMQWEPMENYQHQFDHPRWKQSGTLASAAGHGGGDFFVLEDFINVVDGVIDNPIDIYTAVTWTSLIWLSEESARSGAAVNAYDYRPSH